MAHQLPPSSKPAAASKGVKIQKNTVLAGIVCIALFLVIVLFGAFWYFSEVRHIAAFWLSWNAFVVASSVIVCLATLLFVHIYLGHLGLRTALGILAGMFAIIVILLSWLNGLPLTMELAGTVFGLFVGVEVILALIPEDLYDDTDQKRALLLWGLILFGVLIVAIFSITAFVVNWSLGLFIWLVLIAMVILGSVCALFILRQSNQITNLQRQVAILKAPAESEQSSQVTEQLNLFYNRLMHEIETRDVETGQSITALAQQANAIVDTLDKLEKEENHGKIK